MLKNLTKLLVSLSLVSSLSYAETTGNLVSQDFTTGWTNTTNTYHGSTTIAGHHGGTVTSDSVSLSNDVGLNKNEINQGFTVNSSASVWFWNSYNQSVTMTTQAIDDNGQTITQNRTLSGTCATWNGCNFGSMTDTMVFNSNTQADYDLSLGFSFSVPSYPSGHYAADLKDPSMTVTYTPINLDSTTETALLDLNKTIKEDLKDVQSVEIKEDTSIKTDEVTAPTSDIDKTESPSTLTDTSESPDTSASTDSSAEATPATSSDTSSQEPQKSDQAAEDSKDDKQEATSESSSSQDVADKDDKSSSDSKSSSSVSLGESINNIDAQVKDPGKNLELKNLVMLDKMIDNSALQVYANVEFYKTKDIYTDQIDIRDNRILYANTSLVSYMQKDPVFIKQNEIYNIRLQKQKLIKEIEVLKNAG